MGALCTESGPFACLRGVAVQRAVLWAICSQFRNAQERGSHIPHGWSGKDLVLKVFVFFKKAHLLLQFLGNVCKGGKTWLEHIYSEGPELSYSLSH